MTRSVRPLLPTAEAQYGRADLALAPLDERPALRADAARNRTRLLEAASQLMAGGGVAALTMEAVATAAGVGKGTVFRRFGDRAGLLMALLSHREGQLQAAFLSGPAPLGPDAPAVDRLHAFGPALIQHERDHHELILAARTDPLRIYAVPASRLRLAHVSILLRQAGAEGDVDLLAHTLLGSLETALVHYLVCERGMPLERLEAGWHDLVARLFPARTTA
ncbi:TetR/AcrR family transcriptional regulator [Streptomyces sp. NPDC057148]|uniref:TetR/AcrR family transcriptional regulator n=1 Tax=unclassified Streptomyces TaxID=2593676 RepID=UPI003627B027